MAEVENITVLKKGTKAVQGQTAEQPEMEGQLFHEWFAMRAKQILNEKNPDHEFRFSSHWFE